MMQQRDKDRAATVKKRIPGVVDDAADSLRELALRIHENPETAFEERKAARWLCEWLEREGFVVESGIAGLPTAFRATRPLSSGRGPAIAYLAEYDALPGIGHACGHNLIAAASVGAAAALATAVEEEGDAPPARIVVLGTPGEEGEGGKILMIERGVFDDIDCAMMFHPSVKTIVAQGALAAVSLFVTFAGRAAHAAGCPQEGINALDGLIQTFNGINALRQHLDDDVRIHGIVTDGGAAPNIVPELAEGHFIVRAATRSELTEVLEKVKACARGGALASGARVTFRQGLVYAERINNPVMSELFAENLRKLGIEPSDPPARGGMGSSDIGNVSMVVPSIHPYVAIAPDGVSGHSPEFAEASASEGGIRGMLIAAKALAMTGADLLVGGRLEDTKSAFRP